MKVNWNVKFSVFKILQPGGLVGLTFGFATLQLRFNWYSLHILLLLNEVYERLTISKCRVT